VFFFNFAFICICTCVISLRATLIGALYEIVVEVLR